LETAARETPAARATSSIVTEPAGPRAAMETPPRRAMEINLHSM
jgi:hypothetical protein